MKYSSHLKYSNRETKSRHLYQKYQPILDKHKVLDVGADSMYLKPYVENGGGSYVGVGFGNVDYEMDLDSSPLPFVDESFDTVLCLDVLEHLEHIHYMFSELCRVSRRYVIIALYWSHFNFRLERHFNSLQICVI